MVPAPLISLEVRYERSVEVKHLLSLLGGNMYVLYYNKKYKICIYRICSFVKHCVYDRFISLVKKFGFYLV